jgi:hypothetical protein
MDDFQIERVKRGAEAPAADPLRDDFRKRIVGDEAEVLNRMSFLANYCGAETSASQTKVVMSYLIDLLQKSGALVFDTKPDEDPYRIPIPEYVRTGTIASLLVWLREVTEHVKAKQAAENGSKPVEVKKSQPAPPEPQVAKREPIQSVSLSQAELEQLQLDPEDQAPSVTPGEELAPSANEQTVAEESLDALETEIDNGDAVEGDAKNQLPMNLDHSANESEPVDVVEQKDAGTDADLGGNQGEQEQVTRRPARPDFGATMARDKK